MSDPSQEDPVTATAFSPTAFWKRPSAQTALAASAILAVGLVAGGYLLGDGLTRARAADRSVTVRGLAEKDVVADLAAWTIAYSASAGDMASAQGSVDRDTAAIRAFFEERQFDLVRRGVLLEEGSGMAYTFTRLNDIKPEMVAAATKDARAAAEQFAKDSDTGVGGIKQATQGYFEITGRDGDGGGWGVADTPYKQVRVVTTIDFYLT